MTTTAEAQPVLAPLTDAALFLTVTVAPGGEGAVRDLLGDVGGVIRTVASRLPEGRLSCVVGIGSDLWDRVFAGPKPPELHPFVPLDGARHHAPSTPGDLLFHIRAERADLCFELGRQLVTHLGRSAAVVDETHGFRSFDERDLLGFVDGTENPHGNKAFRAGVIPEGTAFAGGSYVVVQKYLHDIEAWTALTVEQQERVIGRGKADNVEQPDDRKAPDSHLRLNTIVDAAGQQQQIVRDNMPFGELGTNSFGTCFIGYCARLDTIEAMLRNMFLGLGDATHDRILDYSRAVTGGVFFAPALDFFDELPPQP
ncbi:Dyp-type peroxidase [Jatrophihabitans sp. YIM 134969]